MKRFNRKELKAVFEIEHHHTDFIKYLIHKNEQKQLNWGYAFDLFERKYLWQMPFDVQCETLYVLYKEDYEFYVETVREFIALKRAENKYWYET